VVQGSFLDAGADSAMKLDIPVRDTPFSVSSYTESFMKAIETTNVADMYSYMTGVKRNGNTGYDLNIRGFKTSGNDRNAIMVDGLPGLGVRFGSPPTIGVERIEVVKGPASVLYGNAQPGGFVNMTTKKPRAAWARARPGSSRTARASRSAARANLPMRVASTPAKCAISASPGKRAKSSPQMPSAVARRPSRKSDTARSKSFCADRGKLGVMGNRGRRRAARNFARFYRETAASPARKRPRAALQSPSAAAR